MSSWIFYTKDLKNMQAPMFFIVIIGLWDFMWLIMYNLHVMYSTVRLFHELFLQLSTAYNGGSFLVILNVH